VNVRDETGLVGKMIVVWLLVLAVLALGAIDVASIAFTTYQLSDAGTRAASAGAEVYERGENIRDACERAAAVIAREQPSARLTRGGCSIERPTGILTLRIRERANTIVAHRIPWTEEFAVVVVTEAAGPRAL
jgi:hypothetical protein